MFCHEQSVHSVHTVCAMCTLCTQPVVRGSALAHCGFPFQDPVQERQQQAAACPSLSEEPRAAKIQDCRQHYRWTRMQSLVQGGNARKNYWDGRIIWDTKPSGCCIRPTCLVPTQKSRAAQTVAKRFATSFTSSMPIGLLAPALVCLIPSAGLIPAASSNGEEDLSTDLWPCCSAFQDDCADRQQRIARCEVRHD
jgi:hypothetical protein